MNLTDVADRLLMDNKGPDSDLDIDARHERAKLQLNEQIDKLGATAIGIKMQRDALADTLRDIALGAEMMLEPAMQLSGTFEKFAREVLRVARAGLKEAGV